MIPGSKPSIPTTRYACPSCRYDLSALADAVEGGVRGESVLLCPECGVPTTALAASAVRGDRGWGYFILWLAAVFGFLMVFGCVCSGLIWSALNAFGAD